MYKNALLPNTVKYSVFHTSITKGIKEGEKKVRKQGREGKLANIKPALFVRYLSQSYRSLDVIITR